MIGLNCNEHLATYIQLVKSESLTLHTVNCERKRAIIGYRLWVGSIVPQPLVLASAPFVG